MTAATDRLLAHFAPDYAAARRTLLGLVAARGLAAEHHEHPLRGPQGEVLALDVVRIGPPDAANVLLTTSGVHGVEGHVGCGIQAAALHLGEPLRTAADADTAIVHVHAVNPYGFAHVRRVTEENVDLNRNFIDFGQPLPANADYDAVHPLLLPAHWPPTAADEATLEAHLATLGPRRAQMAVSKGQHSHPGGLFYGGSGPTWSNSAFRGVLRRHAGRCRRLAWIDLHSGLGPSGVGERIFASVDTGAALRRARAWWGEGITSVETGSSTSIPMTGPIQNAVADECPQAEYTGICLEFGTVPMDRMRRALRGEHWLHQHPEVAAADAALAASIRRTLRDAFYPDTDAWKRQVLDQGLDALRGALAGLRN